MNSDVISALKTHFGFNELRPAQIPVLESIFEGNDTLTIMPTGGGKSLCYQLPAVARTGLVIVISPLIALMYDQVQSLVKNGIQAGMLNSSQSEEEQLQTMQHVQNGSLKLLYLSPEKLLSQEGQFLSSLKNLDIQLIAIDEAHCVSQWGHDFRPEYTRLSILKKVFPEVPLIALTATADELTRKDIVKQLTLDKPQICIGSFDRPNITYLVRAKPAKKEAYRELAEYIKSYPEQAGIVYCLSRKSTEEVASFLQEQGIQAGAYHAGLDNQTKSSRYSDFMSDRLQVVCATIAFGMGVDKPDVRFVVHWNLPKSIESYYQETGRAGRDGLRSEALLFFNPGDAGTYRRFIDSTQSTEDPQTFQTHQKLQHDKLDRLVEFCNTGHCRRRILLQYFNQRLPQDCMNCDACLHPVQKIDGTITAKKIISAIARTGQKFGIGYITDILLGISNERIERYQHHTLPTFGASSDLKRPELMYYIQQMVSLGMIKVNYDGYIKTLALTKTSLDIIENKVNVLLTPYKEKATVKKSKKVSLIQDNLSQDDTELFEMLRERRKEIAQQEDVPAFVVFSNTALLSMIEIKPTTESEFNQVSGVGKTKREKYWPLFKDILASE